MSNYLFIEANIGGGKSTFTRKLMQGLYKDAEYNYTIVPDKHTLLLLEPVDEWVNMKDSEGKNILEHYYGDPKKYSFAFQMNSFISRCERLQEEEKKHLVRHEDTNKSGPIIMERSVYSDYYCFAKNCFENGSMTEIEYNIYKKWFHWLTESFSIKSKGYIYIRTDPEICYERVKKRARSAEGVIPLEYLTDLHNKHEEWLKSLPENQVLILDGNKDFENNEDIFNEYVEKIKEYYDKINQQIDSE